MLPPLRPDELRDLMDLVAAANRERALADAEGEAGSRLESRFGSAERLAIYGSLAPGRANHHVVEPLGGTYSPGVVHGDLVPRGWGAALGYPALTLRADGPAVAVVVLASPRLRAAWAALDEFEGPAYRRVLAPVWAAAATEARVLLTVANIYEATGEP